jgi:hypothetical protein
VCGANDVEDRVLENKCANGLIKDIKVFDTSAGKSYNSPIKKYIQVIPFPPVSPYRFPPSS